MTTAVTTTLAAPLELPNGAVLPNRIVKAAMSECLGNHNLAPTRRHVELYRRWARSGAGLLITGNIMVDRSAIGEVGNVVVDDRRDIEILAEWAQAARSHGAQVWAQINHPGRQVPLTLNAHPVAPSAVAVADTAGMFRPPRELRDDEIEHIIATFATSAAILVEAGFTGIEIHAAHGYLISQFLSPTSNIRSDRWGGTRENRRRFLLEIVRAVRAEIGTEVTLAVKLNSADFQRGGYDEDEAADVVAALTAEGIDALEISGGTYESTAFMGPTEPVKASTRAREAYFLDFAERIRTQTTVPLLLTGGFRSASGMAAAIDSGAVDLVGIARPLVVEPDLPARLLAGHATAAQERRPRTIGIRRLDGATELLWHTTQLWRLADGKEPAPRRHPLLTMLHYFSRQIPYTAHQLTRRSATPKRG